MIYLSLVDTDASVETRKLLRSCHFFPLLRHETKAVAMARFVALRL